MLCLVKARYRKPLMWFYLYKLASKGKAFLGGGHLTANGHQGSLRVDGNALKLHCDEVE